MSSNGILVSVSYARKQCPLLTAHGTPLAIIKQTKEGAGVKSFGGEMLPVWISKSFLPMIEFFRLTPG